jgi:hypothetical protein
MVEDRLRRHFDYYLGKTEVVIYSVLALLPAVTALDRNGWRNTVDRPQTLDDCSPDSQGIKRTPHCADASGDLHTVRISIRQHVLVTEPFLIVGLIASVRRILVITLEAATLTKEGTWTTESAGGIFHSSMIELGLLGARPPPYCDYESDLYSGRHSTDNPCCEHTRHDLLRTLGDGDLLCTLSHGRYYRRLMKEWISITAGQKLWIPLARETRICVA